MFEREQHVVIHGLLPGPLLARVRREVDGGDFHEHKGIKTDLRMKTGRAATLLAFLTNDPELFETVRAITGCDRIGAFVGHVYRMLPGRDHESGWHADLVSGRMVAMTVNLSDAPYSGGILEIRDSRSKRVLQRVANTGFGDAVIFRLAPGLEHRVTAVKGTIPKTAYAGWFLSEPDAPLLRPGDFLASHAVGVSSRPG